MLQVCERFFYTSNALVKAEEATPVLSCDKDKSCHSRVI